MEDKFEIQNNKNIYVFGICLLTIKQESLTSCKDYTERKIHTLTNVFLFGYFKIINIKHLNHTNERV